MVLIVLLTHLGLAIFTFRIAYAPIFILPTKIVLDIPLFTACLASLLHFIAPTLK